MCYNDAINGPMEAMKLIKEVTKQILTMTIGILALSITFIDVVIPSSPHFIILIFIAWILFILSIIGGLFTLTSMIHLLEQNKFEPFAKCTRKPAIFQWICLIAGLVLLMIFVAINI